MAEETKKQPKEEKTSFKKAPAIPEALSLQKEEKLPGIEVEQDAAEKNRLTGPR